MSRPASRSSTATSTAGAVNGFEAVRHCAVLPADQNVVAGGQLGTTIWPIMTGSRHQYMHNLHEYEENLRTSVMWHSMWFVVKQSLDL